MPSADPDIAVSPLASCDTFSEADTLIILRAFAMRIILLGGVHEVHLCRSSIMPVGLKSCGFHFSFSPQRIIVQDSTQLDSTRCRV
jgi:disulfide bond formation protein DsbB